MNLHRFLQAFRAELSKQHRTSFTGRAVILSLFLWPVVSFFTTYYSMKPFSDGGMASSLSQAVPDGNILLFLATGYAIFQLYWSVVQSAWTFEWERKNGTLEMVFLAPGSRMAFLLGRSGYALFNGAWMFTVFAGCVGVFAWNGSGLSVPHLALALLLTLVAAAAWGAFLSAICLFSRDSGYLYYIFQEPMQLFGSVRIPASVFPFWGRLFSCLFPVTYSLHLVRESLNGQPDKQWWLYAIGLAVASLLLLLLAHMLVRLAESHARRTGSWTLF